MANSIALGEKFLPVLQKIYKASAKTAVLEDTAGAPQKTDIAGTYKIPVIETVGLGDYDKATGSPAGDVTFAWKSYQFARDRARRFQVDVVDDLATFGLAFGGVAADFNKRHVVPEIDAYRISKIASTASIGGTQADLENAAAWKAALNEALVYMDDAEVDDSERVLFITSAGYSAVKNDATTAVQTDAFDRCETIIVPASRMKTAVDLNAGATSDAGGFTAAESAVNVNFLIVDKGAIWAGTEHEALRIWSPSENQGPNAWLTDYRIFYDCFVRQGLESGVYLHKAAESVS